MYQLLGSKQHSHSYGSRISCQPICTLSRSRIVLGKNMAYSQKSVWVMGKDVEDVMSMQESGMFVDQDCTLVVEENRLKDGQLEEWNALIGGKDYEKIVVVGNDGSLRRGDQVIGVYRMVSSADDVKSVAASLFDDDVERYYVVVDATDWKIIPVENLIAAFQGQERVQLVMCVQSVEEARLMNDIMETGTDGVLLRASHSGGIREFARYVRDELRAGKDDARTYSIGVVSRVKQLSMGDRVCVDLAENLKPGQGLLLSSFSRGFFLVHSECEESSYINSRPFRVNAGPVHSYVDLGNNKTGYLSELQSGSEVMVFDQHGFSKPAIVGRMKMERRPLVQIDAKGKDSGVMYSIMLQNAETVKLVGPDSSGHKAISVSSIQEGDEVFLFEYDEASARHTGILIQESIKEY